jgi:hypothetical protein
MRCAFQQNRSSTGPGTIGKQIPEFDPANARQTGRLGDGRHPVSTSWTEHQASLTHIA